jgi:hypothetical protein
MDRQPVDARRDDAAGETVQGLLRVLVVDADAALHRHGQRDGRLHGGDAIAHEARLLHQARAEAAVLNPVGGTAHIEVDLVIAEIGADPGGVREFPRVRAAELHRYRMLRRVEPEQPLPRPVDHGAGRHHLRIEARAARHDPVERPAMAIGPVHHRGNAQGDVFMA